jgi:hypothetical protein
MVPVHQSETIIMPLLTENQLTDIVNMIVDDYGSRLTGGEVTFTFQQDCEFSDLNCLKVPGGKFDVVARYYLPHDEIITGEWTLPKIALQAD